MQQKETGQWHTVEAIVLYSTPDATVVMVVQVTALDLG